MAILQPRRLLTWFLLATATLLSIAPFAALGQSISYDYGFDAKKRMAKRQSQEAPFVVSGPDNRGVVIPRREVRDIEQDEDLWTLYMLGLDYMQKNVEQDDPLSWYGLTGIHGVPYKTWAGVGPTPGNERTGYCTHSSILFPTWHRPYLALYEQVLSSVITDIAGWWSDGPLRERYQAAAARFRIPFWDWAAKPPNGQSVLPLSVGVSAYIKVDGPYGSQVISNPLFTYSFDPFNATAFVLPPWNIWNHTLRSPNTNDTSAVSNNQQVALNFDFNSDSLRQRILVLFRYSNYTSFSNNAWVPAQAPGYYDSLESLHDTVHNLAGGGGRGQPNVQGGHMAFIPYSAFDPLFFLHHCNVDRLFAIWQAVNNDTWVTPQPAILNSYTTSKGQIQDENTALTPFYARLDGTFWTSDTVRDYERFGYTYPEFVGGTPATSGGNASSVRARPARSSTTRVKQAINRLYGHSSASGLFIQEMEARRKGPGGQAGRVGDQATPSIFAERGAVPRKGVVFIGNKYREWIANIYVGKQALNGPFSIHFFLGPDKSIPTDPRDWPFATNHVGTMGVFAAPPMGPEHDGHHDVDISGTVPLTSKLVNKVRLGELDSLQPGDVSRYLAWNLKKRVVTADGRVVEMGEMRRLKNFGVRVVSAEVRAPYTDEDLAVWGEVDVEIDMS